MRIFDLIHQELKKTDLSQAALADRLGLGTDRVCKLLGAPGNWTLDTVSDLLFAICGGVPEYSVGQPLDLPRRNDTKPHYIQNFPLNAPGTSATYPIRPIELVNASQR